MHLFVEPHFTPKMVKSIFIDYKLHKTVLLLLLICNTYHHRYVPPQMSSWLLIQQAKTAAKETESLLLHSEAQHSIIVIKSSETKWTFSHIALILTLTDDKMQLIVFAFLMLIFVDVLNLHIVWELNIKFIFVLWRPVYVAKLNVTS